jgi:glutathione S-transferase
MLHHEKLPSARDRYNGELKRVLSVLKGALEGKQWLVGDKMTFTDLAFAPWNDWIDMLVLCSLEAKFEGFPNVGVWHKRMVSRPSWKRCMEKRAQLME